LAEAAEDDLRVSEEYRRIIKQPGLSYNFEVESFADFPVPVWEWDLNQSMHVQIAFIDESGRHRAVRGIYRGSTITRVNYPAMAMACTVRGQQLLAFPEFVSSPAEFA